MFDIRNESERFPLSAHVRQKLAHFLMDSASKRAVWGGKLNSSIPSLQEAGETYANQGTPNKSWAILPSGTGTRDEVVLYRDVFVEGFRLPCSEPSTFFGVVVQCDSNCVEIPIPEAPQLVKELAKYADDEADRGRDASAEIVNEMLQVLWWGPNFNRSSPNALQEGYSRLSRMLEEVERVRETYGCVGKPSIDHRFDDAQTAQIHNNYKDSLTWMPPHVEEQYINIAQSGKNPYKFVKSRFNVYFNKVWGSKAFFMHLVRYGTTCEIAPLLRLFADFKKSEEYRDIVAANSEKGDLERRLKHQSLR